MGDELIVEGLKRDELRAEVVRLRAAVLNQCADNLCWFTDPAVGRALPEPEFLESCRRYRKQIADGNGEYAGGMTIAQLEAEVERLREEKRAAYHDLREQRRMYGTFHEISPAAPPAPVSAAGVVVACEADPLIIAEIIHFLEGCQPPPNVAYPREKWIKELMQLYKPGWQPEARITYQTPASPLLSPASYGVPRDMTLETARARAVALEDGFREVTKVLASYGAELEQLRKRRDGLIEANNREIERRRYVESELARIDKDKAYLVAAGLANEWEERYDFQAVTIDDLRKTNGRLEVSLKMLRDFLETFATEG